MYSEHAIANPILKNSVDTVWQSQMAKGDSIFVVPDGTCDVIIKANSSKANIFLCDVMTETALIKSEENSKYFGLRFKPGCSSLFFNLKETQNQLIDINNLFHEKSFIEDLMENPTSNRKQIEDLIVEQLLKKVNQTDLKKKQVLIDQYSKIQYGQVDEFSKSLGLSRKRFSRHFKNYFGYDPRYFSKIKKFNQFVKVISEQPKSSLVDVAMTPKELMSQVYNT